MARPKNPTPAAPTDQLNHAALAADSAALTVLGTRSAEIAERFDGGLPYERNRIVSEARFYMGQSAEAMLEAGKRLIVLKENEPHGEFLEIVTERLGLEPRTAQLMMQAAVKYLSPALVANAKTLSHLGKAKLLNLMAESDSDLAALAEGGTIAGKDLDDIQAMSARELRAALVESRKKAAAKDAVIAKKDQKLNELTEAEERRRSGTASEREQQQLVDVREAGLAAEMAVRQLLATAGGVNDAPATEAAGTAARHAVEFVAQVLAGLISERGLAVDFQEMVTPHWLAGVAKHTTGGKAK